MTYLSPPFDFYVLERINGAITKHGPYATEKAMVHRIADLYFVRIAEGLHDAEFAKVCVPAGADPVPAFNAGNYDCRKS